MGSEARCTGRFKGRSATGVARLETAVLRFRGGDLAFSMPFSSITEVAATDGTLRVTTAAGIARLDLGPAAERWAAKIANPPSRLDKIGVKPEWRASAIGIDDETFLAELENLVSYLSIGRAAKESDAIFYGVTKEAHLSRLEKLKRSIRQNGAIWVIRPKGRPEISENAVMTAGKRAGLVDVKVVGFSPTHTAEKFVIPVAART